MNKIQFDIDDLPRLSPWPARLLGLEPWEQRHKTPEDITREYEHEKWGPLLTKVREIERQVLVDEVDEWTLKDVPDSLCSIEGRLELLTAIEAHQRYLNLVENVVTSYLPASALVELGAGYGNIILALARREPVARMHIIAGEYTASGVELIERLAQAQGLKIEAGHCDFASPTIADFVIPENALIFTSCATPCVPKLPTEFVTALSAYRPQAVVHIEPCYEHCDTSTLLGLMRRRYIEVNDYNKNLLTLLYDRQQQGLIRILEERPCVFGRNPLLTASVIVWAPQE